MIKPFVIALLISTSLNRASAECLEVGQNVIMHDQGFYTEFKAPESGTYKFTFDNARIRGKSSKKSKILVSLSLDNDNSIQDIRSVGDVHPSDTSISYKVKLKKNEVIYPKVYISDRKGVVNCKIVKQS